MGSGVYGQVVKCINQTTRELVAVKVFHKAERLSEARREVRVRRHGPVGQEALFLKRCVFVLLS